MNSGLKFLVAATRYIKEFYTFNESSSPIDSTVLRRLLHDFPSNKGHASCQRTIQIVLPVENKKNFAEV
ncbi:hypothetical protein QVD17_11969 [Tagetes erecta]|uniref:Uncharacterized protein n=1 Tax=Tagetes erecta TaxID=13708 RepID=A0AAD8P2N5_TARER|nr:hypothetical protein QVD17_11969 [Tagetes erecta]